MVLLDEKSVELQRLYEKWVVREAWSLEQTVCLFLGLDPVKPVESESYTELKTQLSIAVKTGEVTVLGGSENKPESQTFEPAKVFSWARQNRVELPAELVNLMEFILKAVLPVDPKQEQPDAESLSKTTTDSERILGACLSVLVNYPDECKNDRGKIKTERILKIVDRHSEQLFDGSLPVLSSTGIRDLVNNWVTKL